MPNLLYENEFDLHVNGTHFHMKGYAPRLALKRGTRQLGNGLLN